MAKTVDLPPPDYAKKYEGEDGSTKRYSKFPHRTQGDNDIYLHPSVNSKPNTDVDEYGYLKSESLQRAEYLRMDGGPLSSTYDIQNTYQTNYKRRLQSAPNERMNTAESAYEQPYTCNLQTIVDLQLSPTLNNKGLRFRMEALDSHVILERTELIRVTLEYIIPELSDDVENEMT